MRADDRIRLLHMVEAADAAAAFIAGRTRADLDSDRMLLFAVVRAIEIVGEAANHVTDESRARLTALPWHAMVGMRNRITHTYFQIDTETVWKTATEELPALRGVIQVILEAG